MKHSASLVALVLLTACQSAPPASTSTNIPTSTTASTETPISAPTETPAIPFASETPWPTYEAPTLAPFPLSESQLQPTPSYIDAPAASFSAPLAIGPHDHFYFARPIDSADLKSLIPSQRYGVIPEGGDSSQPHLGLDIGLNAGTPVRAAGSGTVLWASYGLLYRSVNYVDDPYGIAVVIRHDFGFDGQKLYTVYAHLREAKVTVGQHVDSGEVIGLSGTTGNSTGPHLHFEVREGNNTVYFTHNPELWIAPPQGYGSLVGRITATNGMVLTNHLVEVRPQASNKLYSVYSYATEYKILPDDYYNENFVLSDLPAGTYEVAIPYYGVWKRVDIEIKQGEITYFRFGGENGYSFELPADARPSNLPN